MVKRFGQCLVVCLLLVAVGGCGIVDYFFLPTPEDTAEEIYEAGVDAMHEKEYSNAADLFTKLKDKFPFSPYTPMAELGLGDAYYMDEMYFEASQAYKEFESMHPRDEEIPYVLYQVGMCNLKLFDSIDLAPNSVVEAMEYFYRVEESYPESKYSKASKEKIVECRRILAEHELFIADFYWRSGRYLSAYSRYMFVFFNFPDLKDFNQYSKKRAEYSYYKFQQTFSQAEQERIQGSWKEWFDWL